jgi:hypothetical protein
MSARPGGGHHATRANPLRTVQMHRKEIMRSDFIVSMIAPFTPLQAKTATPARGGWLHQLGAAAPH